ncbi:hypothetical protein, partial [Micromonospora globispora]|uniref:hypothetical protein n=1 Tax=Micromonospora globispora TaxID=1450148 RepID=UPI001A9C8AE7
CRPRPAVGLASTATGPGGARSCAVTASTVRDDAAADQGRYPTPPHVGEAVGPFRPVDGSSPETI